MAFRKPKPTGKLSRSDKAPKPAPKVKATLGAEDPAPISLTALRRKARR